VLGVTKLTNVSSREVPKLNSPSISKEPTSSYKYEIYVICDYWNKKETSDGSKSGYSQRTKVTQYVGPKKQKMSFRLHCPILGQT
jgi:hypothetical protein